MAVSSHELVRFIAILKVETNELYSPFMFESTDDERSVTSAHSLSTSLYLIGFHPVRLHQ